MLYFLNARASIIEVDDDDIEMLEEGVSSPYIFQGKVSAKFTSNYFSGISLMMQKQIDEGIAQRKHHHRRHHRVCC